MTVDRFNIHATAIVVGTTGLLFTGSSGAGKSELAFNFLADAKRQGLFHALIGDDQVFVSDQNGHVLAERPQTIAGLLELRYSGLVTIPSVHAALINYVIAPASPKVSERLPPENERFALPFGTDLPLFRIPVGGSAPLEKLTALAENLGKAIGC